MCVTGSLYLNHYIIKSGEVSKADYSVLDTVPAIRVSLVDEDITGIDKDCYNDQKRVLLAWWKK